MVHNELRSRRRAQRQGAASAGLVGHVHLVPCAFLSRQRDGLDDLRDVVQADGERGCRRLVYADVVPQRETIGRALLVREVANVVITSGVAGGLDAHKVVCRGLAGRLFVRCLIGQRAARIGDPVMLVQIEAAITQQVGVDHCARVGLQLDAVRILLDVARHLQQHAVDGVVGGAVSGVVLLDGLVDFRPFLGRPGGRAVRLLGEAEARHHGRGRPKRGAVRERGADAPVLVAGVIVCRGRLGLAPTARVFRAGRGLGRLGREDIERVAAGHAHAVLAGAVLARVAGDARRLGVGQLGMVARADVVRRAHPDVLAGRSGGRGRRPAGSVLARFGRGAVGLDVLDHVSVRGDLPQSVGLGPCAVCLGLQLLGLGLQVGLARVQRTHELGHGRIVGAGDAPVVGGVVALLAGFDAPVDVAHLDVGEVQVTDLVRGGRLRREHLERASLDVRRDDELGRVVLGGTAVQGCPGGAVPLVRRAVGGVEPQVAGVRCRGLRRCRREDELAGGCLQAPLVAHNVDDVLRGGHVRLRVAVGALAVEVDLGFLLHQFLLGGFGFRLRFGRVGCGLTRRPLRAVAAAHHADDGHGLGRGADALDDYLVALDHVGNGREIQHVRADAAVGVGRAHVAVQYNTDSTIRGIGNGRTIQRCGDSRSTRIFIFDSVSVE